ncbi:hypothetical protein QDZ74_005355, partial [Pluralibacter gergoviae]
INSVSLLNIPLKYNKLLLFNYFIPSKDHFSPARNHLKTCVKYHIVSLVDYIALVLPLLPDSSFRSLKLNKINTQRILKLNSDYHEKNLKYLDYVLKFSGLLNYRVELKRTLCKILTIRLKKCKRRGLLFAEGRAVAMDLRTDSFFAEINQDEPRI